MVFVSDKALIVIMFMYAVSFGVLTAQYVYADAYGITLTDFQGHPIRDIFVQISNINQFNNEQNNINFINSTNVLTNPLGTATAIANISLTLVELASGTYIFQILYLLGVPGIFLAGMIGLYIFLLARAVLGWVRGVF